MTDGRHQDGERLRAAWSGARPAAPRDAGCFADEEIWRASRGELGGARLQQILAHAVGCQACAASLGMAGELSREASVASLSDAQAAGRPQEISFERRLRRALIPVAAAAALLLLVGIPIYRMLRGTAAPGGAGLGTQVSATLWKSGAGGDERLADGGAVRPGDRLHLSLSNQVPVHLYVINKDAAGSASVLFPLAQAQWSNPIQPGDGRRIPGETSSAYDSWEVTSAHGDESFIVVASLEPLSGLERALVKIAGAAPGELTRSLDPNVMGGAQAAEGAVALDAELASLRSSPAAGRSLIITQTTVANPR